MIGYNSNEMVESMEVVDESLIISRIYQIRDGIFFHFYGSACADVDLRLNPSSAYKIRFYTFGEIIIIEGDCDLRYNVLQHRYYPTLSLIKQLNLDFTKKTYENYLIGVEENTVLKSKWKLLKDISEIENFDVVKFCKEYNNS